MITPRTRIDRLDALNPATAQHLSATAALIAVKNLESFGNQLSDQHKAALRQLAEEFTSLATKTKIGRYAYPLPTGMGKTQSIVAFCAALSQLQLADIGVVISATKVEALGSLKRDLIANGVPEERIGLIHSYRHDPAMPRESLWEGYASEPSTDSNDDRQFMLVTHNRIKGGHLDRFNLYKGQPRHLVIWDESLLISKARLLPSQALKKALGHLRPDLGNDSLALSYFDFTFEAIEQELTRQRAGAKPQRLSLPVIDSNQLYAIQCEVGRSEVQEVLQMFLEMTTEPLRVIEDNQGQAVVAYDIVVPRELESMAILDASYPIRELEKMDKTIQLGCHFPVDLKRFDQVRLHHLKSPSGRDSVTKSFRQTQRADRKISMEVCQLIAGLPVNEGIIVFTFKTRPTGGRGKEATDFKNILKADLQNVGVDVDVKLPQGHRIVFLTWGQETSLSEYSYCKHVVFAGVLHRNPLQIASEMIGQMDDLYGDVAKSTIAEVIHSEVAHGLYQAVSRGCCRIVRDDQALSMDIWLIHGNDHIRPMLETTMPGLNWLTWKPTYLSTKLKLEAVIKAIEIYLQALPYSVNVVTNQTLRRALNIDVSRNYFREALEIAVANLGTWELVGRRIERRAFGFAEIFGKAA